MVMARYRFTRGSRRVLSHRPYVVSDSEVPQDVDVPPRVHTLSRKTTTPAACRAGQSNRSVSTRQSRPSVVDQMSVV